MMPTNKLFPYNFRDIENVLIVEESFEVIFTFRIFDANILGLLVFISELLQPQTHVTINIGPFLGQVLLETIP